MKKIALKFLGMFIIFTATSQAVDKSSTSRVVEHPFHPLPYAYDALEKAIDSTTMYIHYNKHFRGYYNNFLKAIEGTELQSKSLEEIFAGMSNYPTAVRNNAGGYFNHDLFWQIMSPDGGGLPGGELMQAINKGFNSFEQFKTEFEKAATTRFGSGWAWLSVDKQGKLFISSTPNQDNPLMDMLENQGTPILCLDVWEHAYYLRYQNKRTTYIGNFWDVVNWSEVEKKFKAAR